MEMYKTHTLHTNYTHCIHCTAVMKIQLIFSSVSCGAALITTTTKTKLFLTLFTEGASDCLIVDLVKNVKAGPVLVLQSMPLLN